MTVKDRNAVTRIRDKYVPLLKSCRESAQDYLSTKMENWFEEVENSLMDAADRAIDNRSQLRFIESIRLIKHSKESLKQDFRKVIDQGFDEFVSGQPITYPFNTSGDQAEVDQLSLMDASKVEDFLIVRKIADQFYGHWPEEFYGLEQRLSMTRGGKKVEAPDIPAGPMHAAFAFQKSIQNLGLEEQVYPTLYQLFAQEVLHDIIELYQEFNNILINAGIFPNLKYVAEKQPEGEKRPEVKDKETSAKSNQTKEQEDAKANRHGGDPAEREVVDTISDILNKRRSQDPKFRNNPDINPFAPPREMVDAGTVVVTLQELQAEMAVADYLPPAEESGVGKIASVEIKPEHLDQSRQQISSEQKQFFEKLDPNSVHANDIDIIEMVGMLFEQVLDEPDLPSVVKALLSYLHTPYIKVGILDQAFLVDNQHTARKLLNLMVHAGRYWVDETDLRRGVYYPLKRSVDRILGEFHEDLSIFTELLEELWDKIEKLEKRSETMEKRSRDAAGGHERLLTARENAQKVIDEYVGQRRLHPDILTFLDQVWIERLSFMLLRDPAAQDTQEWKDTVKVIKTLVQAYDGRAHPEMPSRLGSAFPKIRNYIEKALFALGDFHQPRARALFARYDAFIAGDRAALEAEPTADDSAPESEAPAAQDPAPPRISEEEQQMISRLEGLQFGTWFELADSKGKQRLLKLSWSNPVSRHFMFVDQAGVQALMINCEELAQRLVNKEGRIIEEREDQPFVGKALRRIRSLLSGLTGQQRAEAY